jgi:trans-aconitate methyltransferase
VTAPGRATPIEWDAGVYHRVSAPQVAWGQQVLRRLALAGNETVLDAGCGSGRLTAELLERLPAGHVIAVDQSANMLAQAADQLAPRFGGRVSFVQARIEDLVLPEPVDAIFSTATFHWVLDHRRLFRTLIACLKPGGRLVAQCGGGPNIDRLLRRTEALLDAPEFRDRSVGWSHPWEFASAELTARRLHDAGFIDVETSIEAAPTSFPDAGAFCEFTRSVVLRAHLDVLPDATSRDEFMERITALAAVDDPPFILDYWRLNLSAARPPVS